jgi:hypothetical protein
MRQGLGGRRARTRSLPEALGGALWPPPAASRQFGVLALKAEVPQNSSREDIRFFGVSSGPHLGCEVLRSTYAPEDIATLREPWLLLRLFRRETRNNSAG